MNKPGVSLIFFEGIVFLKKIYLYGTRGERKNYAEALEACSAEPVLSLTTEGAEDCDGLLLCGGGDIEPHRYGQENQGSKNFELERDEVEFALVEKFMNAGKPILGICRGLQVLNVALGGTLVQDLPTAATHAWQESSGDQHHMVKAVPGSFLDELYGPHFLVKSAHHQGADQVPELFQVMAWADDGGIEALACPEKKIYAVQWHPERMMLSRAKEDTVNGQALFEFFLSLC